MLLPVHCEKKIILYTIPIILGVIVQNCFNAVDLIVLGNLADSTAVAAIAGIEYGRIRMFFVLLFMSVSCAKGIYSSGLQSCGYVLYTTLSSIIGVFGSVCSGCGVFTPISPHSTC